MRRISLEKMQPGMVLANTIYGRRGQVLLKAGLELKPHYSVYLRHLGVDALYVHDYRISDATTEDVIAEETRREARTLVEEILEDCGQNSRQKSLFINDVKLKKIVVKIIKELLSNRELVVNLQDIRTAATYIFAHSVNTCVLATLTAIKLQYGSEELKTLATGCLLHDLGCAAIPQEILQKKGALDQIEMDLIKNHPLFGLKIFKQSPLFTENVGAIIYQHHERWNGKGYPEGLKKNIIHALAQITAVADVYDALTSTRPYRPAYRPHQAVEMLSAWGEEYFNLDILRTFLSLIAAYPVGSHVVLSNGESGLVIANTPGYTLRPYVRILYMGEGMAPHPSPYEVDLTETLDLTVEKVLD